MSEKHPPFSLLDRLKSIGYALKGIGFMLTTQHNAWVHLVATIIVTAAGFFTHVSSLDWRWLIASMVVVWVAETFNTAVEYVCDVVSPEYNHAVKQAKDIAAGAVLITAFGAVIIGLTVFLPYWMKR